MSPKTMPRAASTTPPATGWAIGCAGAVSPPSGDAGPLAGSATGADGAVPLAGLPGSTLGAAARDADSLLRAAPGTGSLVTGHPPGIGSCTPKSVYPTSASPQK